MVGARRHPSSRGPNKRHRQTLTRDRRSSQSRSRRSCGTWNHQKMKPVKPLRPLMTQEFHRGACPGNTPWQEASTPCRHPTRTSMRRRSCCLHLHRRLRPSCDQRLHCHRGLLYLRRCTQCTPGAVLQAVQCHSPSRRSPQHVTSGSPAGAAGPRSARPITSSLTSSGRRTCGQVQEAVQDQQVQKDSGRRTCGQVQQVHP